MWYQVFLFNTNNFSTDLLDTYKRLTGTTTPGQSGPRSNDNEGILHTLLRSRTEAALPDAV